ncbi:MAG TPA: serine/threonine-protein kinase [Polyangiaceae bacterium]|nr:serine/threonine-protein kinase [Polyangiaceae bacterium]
MLANTLETYAPPRQLGRYDLIAPLGEGGMARVYVAVQRGPIANKLVVVKVLREQFTGDPQFVAMFADESRIAVLLNHPNVIHTYESSSTDSDYYIVMEFLEGRTLAQLIRRVGRENFPLETHLWILCEILSGLAYAHELADFGGVPLNIVHRDVSPSNILLTVRGEVKLLDFGIAKVQGAIAETQIGIIKGKLGYASPEQCLGTKADGRADLYSVGVMLWEALAGKRRPMHETALATTRPGAHSEHDITETLPGVPLVLARIVKRALALEPADRFQTARAFELELRKYLVDRACSRGAPSLQALLIKHFATEFAAIRRIIDEQVGSVRHSIPPEPRSVRTSHPPPVPSSEAPPTVGFTAPPKPPVNRLHQLSTAAAVFGVLSVVGALWFARSSQPSAHSAQRVDAALAAARPAAPTPSPLSPASRAAPPSPTTAREPAAPLATPSSEEGAPEPGRAKAPAPVAPTPPARRRPSRSVRSQVFTVALKPPSATPTPPPKPTTPDGHVLDPPAPAQSSLVLEPGVDLRLAPPTATARSLDERDPYAP